MSSVHSANEIILSLTLVVEPVLLERLQHIHDRLHRREPRRGGINHYLVSQPPQFVRRQVWSLAGFRHVDQQRNALAKARANRLHLFDRPRTVDKKHVGACLEVRLAARQRRLEAFDGDCIGASDDDEIGVLTHITRSADFLRHFLDWNERLALEMSATLGPHLILDVDSGHPCALELTHRAPRIDGIAEARVRIADNRQAHRHHYVSRHLNELCHGDQAEVGHPEQGARDAGTGEIHGGKSHALDDPRTERVIGAGSDQHFGRAQQLAQSSGAIHWRVS